MNIFEQLMTFFSDGAGAVSLQSVGEAVLRIAIPVLALVILLRCAGSLLGFRREPEIWAWLRIADSTLLPVTHWENLIGRKKSADIQVDFATVSKNHAVLTRLDDGSWTVREIEDKGRVEVNGKPTSFGTLQYGDVLTLGGVPMTLEPISEDEKQLQAQSRTKPGSRNKPGLTLVVLTVLQLLMGLALLLHVDAGDAPAVMIGFGALLVLEWILYIGQKIIRRSGFEVEILAFFLCTVGMAVICSNDPSDVKKQLITVCAGIVIFLFLGWALRDLERARWIRYAAAVVSILLLLINLIFGKEMYGAKNWIYIGGISFQPSELVKICFVFVGASNLDHIVTKRNLILFIVYSAFICGCLALMSDFGTALIFFVSFLVIAYLRSGNFAAIALSVSGLGIAGVFALRFFPYVKRRFQAWGHIWEHALDSGYQQTRALMCIASGGLFGLGAGVGWLKYVAASDTDLVFAFVSEEWGLILAILMVAAVGVLGLFVVRSSAESRSSFYTIAACAAISIFAVQTILNVFGTVDFLPLTGVTFPFASNGGSSMLASWGLLSFIKACDTRQNASFAVRLSAKKGGRGT